jgi:hypothetical protein
MSGEAARAFVTSPVVPRSGQVHHHNPGRYRCSHPTGARGFVTERVEDRDAEQPQQRAHA